jgi:hypothetical protein
MRGNVRLLGSRPAKSHCETPLERGSKAFSRIFCENLSQGARSAGPKARPSWLADNNSSQQKRTCG